MRRAAVDFKVPMLTNVKLAEAFGKLIVKRLCLNDYMCSACAFISINFVLLNIESTSLTMTVRAFKRYIDEGEDAFMRREVRSYNEYIYEPTQQFPPADGGGGGGGGVGGMSPGGGRDAGRVYLLDGGRAHEQRHGQ
jgi:hypothetical protein